MGVLESLSLCAKEQPVLAQHGQQRALPHRADCSRLGLKEQGCMEQDVASIPLSVERSRYPDSQVWPACRHTVTCLQVSCPLRLPLTGPQTPQLCDLFGSLWGLSHVVTNHSSLTGPHCSSAWHVGCFIWHLWHPRLKASSTYIWTPPPGVKVDKWSRQKTPSPSARRMSTQL